MIKSKSINKVQVAILAVLALFVMCSASWAASYHVDATNGNDNNNGLSPSTAWKTIAKVNNSRFNPGDSILLKRGEIWREWFAFWSAGTAAHPIMLHNYGIGPLPIIDGSDVVTGWSQVGKTNVWKKSLAIEPMQVWEDDLRLTWAGDDYSIDSSGQWYWESGTLYIRCTDDTNPSTHTIEAGQRHYGILVSHRLGTSALANNHHIIIDGIQVQKVAATGITDSNGANLAYSIVVSQGHDIIVKNCVVRQMGGGKYYTDGGRGQNWSVGIEFWNSYACQAINNVIYDGHCVGISPESMKTGEAVGYTVAGNVIHDIDGIGLGIQWSGGDYYENEIYNCGNSHPDPRFWYGVKIRKGEVSVRLYQNNLHNNYNGIGSLYEIENQNNITINNNLIYDFIPEGGSHNKPGHGIWIQDGKNVNVYNNTIVDLNGHSGSLIKVDAIDQWDSSGVVIKNNIFYGKASYLLSVEPDQNITLNYNIYYSEDAGNAFNWKGTKYTFANFVNYQLGSGQDANSIAQDPLFTNGDNANFSLQSSSPCIDAGTDVGLTSDYTGICIESGAGVDIGAYEYRKNTGLLAPPDSFRILTTN